MIKSETKVSLVSQKVSLIIYIWYENIQIGAENLFIRRLQGYLMLFLFCDPLIVALHNFEMWLDK